MTRLTIFSLDTVIRYSETNLRKLLFQLISEREGISMDSDPAPEIRNFQALLNHIFQKEIKKELSEENLAAYQKAFKKAVKKYYLDDEDAFEVRPGVQSLFGQMDKEKKWKFGIASDLWEEATQFLLQSCGVFSKDKLTICAETAPDRNAQMEILASRAQKKDQGLKIYVVCLNGEKPELSKDFKIIRPKASDKESNYYVYPRFNELFKLKKKNKKRSSK